MGLGVNFFFALIIATGAVAGGSLLWPRLTSQPRPKVLTDVKNIVLKTSIGRESATVLGVSDETHVQPINVGQIAAGAVGQVKTAVSNRVQEVIVGNAVNQLHQQFEKLSPQQKEQIQQIICQPLEKK